MEIQRRKQFFSEAHEGTLSLEYHTWPGLWRMHKFLTNKLEAGRQVVLGGNSIHKVWLIQKSIGTLMTCLEKRNLFNEAETWVTCTGISGNKSYEFLSQMVKGKDAQIYSIGSEETLKIFELRNSRSLLNFILWIKVI